MFTATTHPPIPSRRDVLTALAVAPVVGPAMLGEKVELQTDLGRLLVELDGSRAPGTVANFLAYVDQGWFADAAFYRIVRPDNDPSPHPIHVLQGGLMASGDSRCRLPPIRHESTAETGLRHIAGAISMARAAPGTACSEFFICLGPNPELDAGGRRNPDGRGFSVFGRVTAGLDLLLPLDQAPVRDGPVGAPARQWLITPVTFRASRVPHGMP